MSRSAKKEAVLRSWLVELVEPAASTKPYRIIRVPLSCLFR